MLGDGPSNFPPVRRGGGEARAGAGVRNRGWKSCAPSSHCRVELWGEDSSLLLLETGVWPAASWRLCQRLCVQYRCYPTRALSPFSCRDRSSWQLIRGVHQIKLGLCVSLAKKKKQWIQNELKFAISSTQGQTITNAETTASIGCSYWSSLDFNRRLFIESLNYLKHLESRRCFLA